MGKCYTVTHKPIYLFPLLHRIFYTILFQKVVTFIKGLTNINSSDSFGAQRLSWIRWREVIQFYTIPHMHVMHQYNTNRTATLFLKTHVVVPNWKLQELFQVSIFYLVKFWEFIKHETELKLNVFPINF